MKLASTFNVPVKINLSSQESEIKDGYLNISLKAGLGKWQIAKTFFYLSFYSFGLAVKHLFKKQA